MLQSVFSINSASYLSSHFYQSHFYIKYINQGHINIFPAVFVSNNWFSASLSAPQYIFPKHCSVLKLCLKKIMNVHISKLLIEREIVNRIESITTG